MRPGGAISELFKCVDREVELAFVAIDWWAGEPHAVLYELYVPVAMRGQGVGAAALRAVEELVLNRGRQRLHLIPRPLDYSRTAADLEAWYARRGYTKIEYDNNDMFGKDLKPRIAR
jgi:GNAT superfamily N-acetyltransferase